MSLAKVLLDCVQIPDSRRISKSCSSQILRQKSRIKAKFFMRNIFARTFLTDVSNVFQPSSCVTLQMFHVITIIKIHYSNFLRPLIILMRSFCLIFSVEMTWVKKTNKSLSVNPYKNPLGNTHIEFPTEEVFLN